MFKTRSFIAIAFAACCFLAVSVQAQSKSKTSDPERRSTGSVRVAREGVGVDGIVVGKSTMSDVVKKYGKTYKWIAHKKYSFSMSYPDLGIAFYICQSDPKKAIFDIEMREPFKVKTAKGVVLGSSTVADIERLYGKSNDGLEYKGVNFYYANRKGKKIVTVIDIIEMQGIRQCRETPAPPAK